MAIIVRDPVESFKPVFDVLKDVVQDCNLLFNITESNGLQIHATGWETMLCIHADLTKVEYYNNEMNEIVHFGVYIPFLHKAMKSAKKSDLIELVVNKTTVAGEYIMEVNIISPDGVIASTTSINSIMMPVEMFAMENFQSYVNLDGRAMWAAFRDVAAINNLATLSTPDLNLKAQHPMGDLKIDLSRIIENPVPLMAHSTVIVPAKLMTKLLKLKSIGTVKMDVSNLSPLGIVYDHPCGFIKAAIATTNK